MTQTLMDEEMEDNDALFAPNLYRPHWSGKASIPLLFLGEKKNLW